MRNLILIAAAMVALNSCQQIDLPSLSEQVNGESKQTKAFTFMLKGDFTQTALTRASSEYMVADGKELTDLWVMDVVNGEVVQQKHLTPADDDWGTPRLDLTYGTHHVYFLASRGTSPTLTGTTVTWAKCLDTFYKDYDVTVVKTSNGNRAVTLDRIVTNLKITMDDAIKTGCRSITATPATWYNGINIVTGELTKAYGGITIQTTQASEGMKGVSLSYYWLAPATEYTTDVTLNAYNENNEKMTEVMISNAPFVRNRRSEYHGNLFAGNTNTSLSLNTVWEDSYEGGEW